MSADINPAMFVRLGYGEAQTEFLATLEARYDALQDRITRHERKGKRFKALLLTHRADELAEAIAIVRGKA